MDLKRSISKRVKSLLGLQANASIEPSSQAPAQGIQAVKYDEVDPLTVMPTPQTRPRTSSTSLPALLKRSKLLIGSSSNSVPTVSAPSKTPLTPLAAPKRMSGLGLLTPVSRESLIQMPSSAFTNLHLDLVKALTINTRDMEDYRGDASKLDLLPPNPLKSPASEDQLSPSLPLRITTPIFESEPFFLPPHGKRSSADLNEVEFSAVFLNRSQAADVSRSRQNSSATSFSSSTNYYKNQYIIADENIEAKGLLNDPFMYNLLYNNKDLVGSEDVEEGELQDAFCDEIALEILGKVNLELEVKPKTPFEYDEKRVSRTSKWFI